MKKIYAYTKRDIPLALCNYMYSRKGHEADAEEFKRVINASKTATDTCNKLNNHKWTNEKFEPYRIIENGFIIMATDPWGNKSYIRITEE